MVERLLLDRVDTEPARVSIGREHDSVDVVDHLAGSHETHPALTVAELAGTRTDVALDSTVVELMPVLGRDRELLHRTLFSTYHDDIIGRARRGSSGRSRSPRSQVACEDRGTVAVSRTNAPRGLGMSVETEVNVDDASAASDAPDLDVVVVGAGMAGLYLLYRLRRSGACRRRRSKQPTMSVARGTGIDTPALAATFRASTTPTASTRSCRTSGSGRRSTQPSPRSCAISSTSPTSTISAVTFRSPPVSRAPTGTTTHRCGVSAPTRAMRSRAGTT